MIGLPSSSRQRPDVGLGLGVRVGDRQLGPQPAKRLRAAVGEAVGVRDPDNQALLTLKARRIHDRILRFVCKWARPYDRPGWLPLRLEDVRSRRVRERRQPGIRSPHGGDRHGAARMSLQPGLPGRPPRSLLMRGGGLPCLGVDVAVTLGVRRDLVLAMRVTRLAHDPGVVTAASSGRR